MRRKVEWALALTIGGLAAIGTFGPSLPASGQIPPPPTMPPFTTPSIPPPPTRPPFTRPTFTVPPPPTMPPQTTSPTSPPPTMPPPTRPPVTLPPAAEQAIQNVIDTLEQFGDQFAELIDELRALAGAF